MKIESLSLDKFKRTQLVPNSIDKIRGGAYWTTAIITAPADNEPGNGDFDAEQDWFPDYDPFE